MSLKSFDEFCAKMINNEPIKQKEIFDERQKITRSQITLRAAILFGILSVANTVIMDCGAKWSETFNMPMFWFYMISYIYWLIANSIKGSLVGIEGTRYLKRSGMMMIFVAAMYFIPIAFNEDKFEVLSNSVLSNEFMMIVLLVMALVSGIVSLLLVRYYNKKQAEEQPKK